MTYIYVSGNTAKSVFSVSGIPEDTDSSSDEKTISKKMKKNEEKKTEDTPRKKAYEKENYYSKMVKLEEEKVEMQRASLQLQERHVEAIEKCFAAKTEYYKRKLELLNNSEIRTPQQHQHPGAGDYLQMLQQPMHQANYQPPMPQSSYQQPMPQSSYQQTMPQSSYQQPMPQSSYQQPMPQSSCQQSIPSHINYQH